MRILAVLCLAAGLQAEDYGKVITKDAKTHHGIFTVHEIGDRYYYEIPNAELDKEFLWNTRIAKTTLGVGFGGVLMADRVVRWHLKGEKMLLLDVNYEMTADPKSAIAPAVEAANNQTIVMSFDVAATSKDGAPVIEVTRFFNTDIAAFNLRRRLGATMLDTARSSIDKVAAYPRNIEVEATQTWVRNDATVPGWGQMQHGNATIVVHHSMVKLPEHPMAPREFDDRIGFFATSQYDYSRDEARAPHVRYIHRWRLEKKDPAAALSDPVKPIVYYIDPATPVKWRESIKRAVESWQPAFEAAGFRNAIIARMAPDEKEDPEFSPEDVRYSVVRWLPSTVENAFGPNIIDPRTGEILNADIEYYHNMMNLTRTWYFTQIGPLDPRAAKLPLPDDVTGQLIQYVVSHEVGHTLGLEHNLKASSLYPAEKVHDKAWVGKMGYTPSIMDYVRFNYVAQPEDQIPVEDLMPHVGPYDRWAIHWGYAPIAAGREKQTLNQWAKEQDETPWLRYSTPGSGGADSGELTEAIGDADAVQSTALGMKNLRRVAKMLIPATSAKPDVPLNDLAELYNGMLGQWAMEMNHVVAIVGNFNAQTKYSGQSGRVYMPVPRVRQKQAVAFLNENAFSTPDWAIDPEILRRIEPSGALNRIRNAQTGVLNNLLNSARFNRLVEQEALDGAASWSPGDFLAMVRRGLWRELDQPRVRIDAYRRNLQRAYLDIAISRAAGGAGDEKPLYRAELKSLKTSIRLALSRTVDRETRAHLESADDRIERMLLPQFAPSSGTPAPVNAMAIQNCWPDYSIRPD